MHCLRVRGALLVLFRVTLNPKSEVLYYLCFAHVSEVVYLFCIVYVLEWGYHYPRRQEWRMAGRKPRCYSSTRLPVWYFMFLCCMYVRTYIRMYDMCGIHQLYVRMICVVFINSPAKARGKGGRQRGKANEGGRGLYRELVRRKENEKGGGGGGGGRYHGRRLDQRGQRRG